MNIPKKIHYCWFGSGEMDKLSWRCMASWQRFCSDYELIRWDESNSPLADNNYVQQAYAAGKWAFVSDYVRAWALSQQGGIYLDTDVELLASLDAFLENEAFMGFEAIDKVATCVLGCQARNSFFERWLAEYAEKQFIRQDGSFDETTNVEMLTDLLVNAGLRCDNQKQMIAGVCVYPQDYFSPKDLHTGKINCTARTVAIHHFSASWMSKRQRFNTKVAQLLGPRLTGIIKRGLDR